MNDRKRMRKLRVKRVESVKQQVEKHEEKIEKEKGRKDTTKDYWRKEIDEKFLKQLDEDEEYLEDK
jgi:predicted RNA-binding protein with PIN domain